MLNTGETEIAAQTNTMAAKRNRVPRLAPDVQGLMPGKAYSSRSRRPTIGVGPGFASGSTRNTILRDANVAA